MELEIDRSAIDTGIKEVFQFLETLDSDITFESKNLLSWFKSLCGILTKLVALIANSFQKYPGETRNGETLLYLNHLLTSLTLLINIFVTESDKKLHFTIARDFGIKRIKWCLDGIEETLLNTCCNKDTSASFIKWMDLALDKISEIDFENQKSDATVICKEAKSLSEEVLSHAMSIAQVALMEDCKIIRGRSQAVLGALDDLTSEMGKTHPNTPMVNLFIETCSNELCALERQVNTAVLKLSLKVFSEYTLALESIQCFCFDRYNSGKLNNLEALVMEYDLHVDRIMQIGLFAVSCSTSSNKCTKIKSCLASLEALETELVPAFTSVLIDPSTYNMQQTLLLKGHWLNQAVMLKNFIFLIIDPFAFSQVIYEENKELLENISDKIESTNSLVDRKSLGKFLKHSIVLKEFVDVVLEEQQEPNTEKIRKNFQDFKNVLHELQAASEILSEEEKNNLRIMKRCRILLTTIKNLRNCFQETDLENNPNHTVSENSTKKGSQIQYEENPFIDHIISRGKQILKDRSILHLSSFKNENFDIKSTTMKKMAQAKGKSLPLSRMIYLRKMSFMSSVIENDGCSELQMTDIMKELNNITRSSLGTL